jgi:hypothetical protein
VENASRAFLAAVRTSMRQVRSAVGAATIDVALLTAAERIQYEGYLRREEANAAILRLRAGGIPIKGMVRRTGHSRGLVRKVLRGQRTDLSRPGKARWRSTCRGSKSNGRRDRATAPSCGVGSEGTAFVDPCGSSRSGQPAAAGPNGPPPALWVEPLRRGPWPA